VIGQVGLFFFLPCFVSLNPSDRSESQQPSLWHY
jgi:hypothetical protein